MDLQRSKIETSNVAAEYRERLFSALTDPVYLNLSEYTNDKRPYAPTPLDPDQTTVTGSDYRIHPTPMDGQLNFRFYSLMLALHSVEQFEGNYPDTPEWLSTRLRSELEAQINNRCDHNNASLERLVEAVSVQGVCDGSMIDIIGKARSGMADPQELLRIIKEYPAIQSIEVSSYRDVFNMTDIRCAVEAARESAHYMAQHFDDAEVTVYDNPPVSSTTLSKDVPGVKVSKHVLARAESRDSATEYVMKTTWMLMPRNDFVPVGVTTYLRAADKYHQPSDD